jgi:hypothetical protein
MASKANDLDIGFDFEITKVSRQPSGGTGTWVSGKKNGHRFEALVFPEHAEVAEYELGDSRISKLWIQRLADRATLFNWDRGEDIPAKDEVAGAIADFLACGLADHIFGE